MFDSLLSSLLDNYALPLLIIRLLDATIGLFGVDLTQ